MAWLVDLLGAHAEYVRAPVEKALLRKQDEEHLVESEGGSDGLVEGEGDDKAMVLRAGTWIAAQRTGAWVRLCHSNDAHRGEARRIGAGPRPLPQLEPERDPVHALDAERVAGERVGLDTREGKPSDARCHVLGEALVVARVAWRARLGLAQLVHLDEAQHAWAGAGARVKAKAEAG